MYHVPRRHLPATFDARVVERDEVVVSNGAAVFA